jgi:enoyl-CoA hydratase/carnithine racemase
MMSDLVTLIVEEDVATITINRPEKRNSLTPEMLSDLENVLIEINTLAGIRFVILTGSGEKAFCTGADLSAFSSLNFNNVRENWVPEGHRIFKRLSRLPQITVAFLNGDAFGGGLELALACDFRIAVDTVSVGFPEGKVGTIPGWAGTTRAVDLIGLNRAKYMILSGKSIDAKQALDWGLLNVIAPSSLIGNELEKFLQDFSSVSPMAQKISKQLMSTFENTNNAEVLEAFAGALSNVTEDFKEGVAAFKEKRQAKFTGR